MKKIIFCLLMISVILISGCDKTESVYQFELPKEGEMTAEIVIKDYGSIKLRLFEAEAPKAVGNFAALAQQGYYDGAEFFRVVEDYMIQCAAGQEDSETYSIYGGYFEDEFSESLNPYRGALCMANMGTEDTNASQFFIVGQTAEQLTAVDELLAYKGYTMAQYMQHGFATVMADEQLETYYTYGGTPWLYGHNTVFGQIYEGYDVLDAILGVRLATDGVYTPAESVIIERIEIQN